MHKNIYKIKAAFSCNKNFINSINELKPFLGFDLNEIHLQKETNSINLENEVLIVDSSCVEKVPFEKINIPIVLDINLNNYKKNAEYDIINLKHIIFENPSDINDKIPKVLP